MSRLERSGAIDLAEGRPSATCYVTGDGGHVFVGMNHPVILFRDGTENETPVDAGILRGGTPQAPSIHVGGNSGSMYMPVERRRIDMTVAELKNLTQGHQPPVTITSIK